MPDDEFRVLLVCTANVCRSPIAEHLFRRAISHSSVATWEIESAGTRAEPGLEMHPLAERVLTRKGVDVSRFRTQRLSRGLIDEADLILTAERMHRAAVVTLEPRAVRNTFTIRQFARMASGVTELNSLGDPAALGRELVAQATEARSGLQPLASRDEDIPDPMGRGSAAFRRCANHLTQLISEIISPLDAHR